jgi:hypothetical protein
MAFIPAKESKNEYPWESYPAAVGTYQAGQIVQLSGGVIKALTAALTVTPSFICKSAVTIASPPTDLNGGKVLVMPFTTDEDEEYYAPLAAQASTNFDVGALMSVASDGLSLAEAAGKALLLETVVNGTPVGTFVRVKFTR